MGRYNDKLSIYLSYLLRHHPEEIGDPHEVMDIHGWVDVERLINGINSKGKYAITHEMLKKIVAEDKKGRYRLENGRIKCCQGHSLEWIEPELAYKEPPEFLYHGTNKAAVDKIFESGHISRMSRHAVHMQADIGKARQSAERWHQIPVILKIDAGRMYKKGVAFGVTENDVWCVDDIPAKYIADVIMVFRDHYESTTDSIITRIDEVFKLDIDDNAELDIARFEIITEMIVKQYYWPVFQEALLQILADSTRTRDEYETIANVIYELMGKGYKLSKRRVIALVNFRLNPFDSPYEDNLAWSITCGLYHLDYANSEYNAFRDEKILDVLRGYGLIPT